DLRDARKASRLNRNQQRADHDLKVMIGAFLRPELRDHRRGWSWPAGPPARLRFAEPGRSQILETRGPPRVLKRPRSVITARSVIKARSRVPAPCREWTRARR